MAETVETVGFSAFEGCISLEAIDFLPVGLKEIGQSAFDDCYSVSEIWVPEGVKTIGSYAFSYCGSMLQYQDDHPQNFYYINNVSDPVKELGDQLITDEKYPKFVTVHLPSTIEQLSDNVFNRVFVDSIFLPEGMREVSQLPEFDESTFSGIRYIMQIYLDDKTTQAQMDAMDQFFMGFEEVGDRCWWYEGKHVYFTIEGAKRLQ
jgi:hypothetical protein